MNDFTGFVVIPLLLFWLGLLLRSILEGVAL